MSNSTCTALGTTACDRRKMLVGEDRTSRSDRRVGIERTAIVGARDVRYWQDRCGERLVNVRTGHRLPTYIVMTYTPAATGGCDAHERFDVDGDDAFGDPNDVDVLGLLGLAS